MNEISTDPAFDHRWLEALSQWCRKGQDADEALVDLYLERRLELRLHVRNDVHWVEECRTEGAAVRTRTDQRNDIVAATGTSPKAIAHLLSGRIDTRELQVLRPLPSPDLDAPRDWKQVSRQWIDSGPERDATVTIFARRAAVIRPGTWREIHSPLLVRAETPRPNAFSLLTTWNPDRLPPWPAPAPGTRRTWAPAPGETLPVVLTDGTSGVLIHELIGHLLEGDVICSGRSPLVDRGGEPIGPPTLSVTDDPTRFDLPGAFSADDEGASARPIDLLREGVVRGLLCDRFSAEALGAEAGRGRRASWTQTPVSRMSNLIVTPGTESPDSLEHDVRHGLVVTRLGGASVDPKAGTVALRVEQGWELRHGRRRRALGPMHLGGDLFSILQSIDPTLGNDPTSDWRLGWCLKDGHPIPTGSLSPSILVRSMVVG